MSNGVFRPVNQYGCVRAWGGGGGGGGELKLHSHNTFLANKYMSTNKLLHHFTY